MAHRILQNNQRNLLGVLTLCSGIFGFLMLYFLDRNERLFFCSVGLISFSVVLMPVFLMRDYRYLSCWSFGCVSVFIGLFLRGIYISAGYPNLDVVNRLWLLDSPIDRFYLPSVLLVGGLLCCVIGYMLGPKVEKRQRVLGSYVIRKQPLYLFAIIALVTSVASILLLSLIHI